MRKLSSTATPRRALPYIRVRLSLEDKNLVVLAAQFGKLSDNAFAVQAIMVRARKVIALLANGARAKPMERALLPDDLIHELPRLDVRLEVEEKEVVRRAAGLVGKSVSEFAKRAILARARTVVEKKSVQYAPVSGSAGGKRIRA